MTAAALLSNGTAESGEAALRARLHAPAMRATILRLLAEFPGLTCEEVEAMLGFKHQTASARLHDLVEDGRVRYESRRGARGRLLRHYYVADGGPSPEQLSLGGDR